jgi:uncharacterized membrane protein
MRIEGSQFVQDAHESTPYRRGVMAKQPAVTKVSALRSATHMAPLIVMLVIWLVARSIGVAVIWHQADSWTGALRIALAVMFVFTAVSHFHPRTRPDLIRMVPTSLPAPGLLVTATGALEFMGAIGLLVPQALPAATYGLIALLAAMFPANVHAARAGLIVAGRRSSPLVWRLPLQLFWMSALWWVR